MVTRLRLCFARSIPSTAGLHEQACFALKVHGQMGTSYQSYGENCVQTMGLGVHNPSSSAMLMEIFFRRARPRLMRYSIFGYLISDVTSSAFLNPPVCTAHPLFGGCKDGLQ